MQHTLRILNILHQDSKTLRRLVSIKKCLEAVFEITSTCGNHMPTIMHVLLYTMLDKCCDEFFSPLQRYVLVALSRHKQSRHMDSSLFQQLGILGVLRKESSCLLKSTQCFIHMTTCNSRVWLPAQKNDEAYQYSKLDTCAMFLVLTLCE